jgi:DNA-binding MarR family transcriptional regulator
VQATAAQPQASDTDLARQLSTFVGYLMQTHSRDVMQLSAEFEFSLSQMKALQSLFNATEPVSVKSLGEGLGLSLAAMSRAADGLVQRGLVARLEDTHDRRIKRLSLTDSGRAIVQRLREVRTAGFDQFVASLTPKEHALLAKALKPILARDDLVAFCGGPAK